MLPPNWDTVEEVVEEMEANEGVGVKLPPPTRPPPPPAPREGLDKELGEEDTVNSCEAEVVGVLVVHGEDAEVGEVDWDRGDLEGKVDALGIEGGVSEELLVLKPPPPPVNVLKAVEKGVNVSVAVPPPPFDVAVAPPPPAAPPDARDAVGRRGVGVGSPPEGVGNKTEEVMVGMEGGEGEGEKVPPPPPSPPPADTLGQFEEEREIREEMVVKGERDGFTVNGGLFEAEF